MATNLGKPLRLRNDGGVQLQLERSGSLTSLETTSGGGLSLSTAGTLALAATGANPITLATNGVERLRITSDGNVGIGTTTPTVFANFTTVEAFGATGGIFRANNGANIADFYVTPQGAFAGSVSNDPFRLITNSTERLRITAAGHTLPGSNNAYDLGEAATAFRNLHAAGAVVSFAGLPTSDPGVAGRLWRSGADVKVSI